MDDNETRAFVTLIIWIAVVAIFLAGSASAFAQGILIPVAGLATIGIWIAPYLGTSERDKAKRHSAADIDENEVRLRVLMDMLDDEDKARIRAKLMNGFSDGELPVDEFLEDTSSQSLQSES